MTSSSFLSSLLIFLSVLWITNIACVDASSESRLGFSMNLIHRDSPLFPHCQPSPTSKDRIRAMIDRSLTQARYLSSIFSGRSSASASASDHENYSNYMSTKPTSPPSSPQAQILLDSDEYLVELEIDTPPFKVKVVADTASHMTWIQCNPCLNCYNQTDPIFDSSKSSTYNLDISCQLAICYTVSDAYCFEEHTCEYEYIYGDYSDTQGFMATDIHFLF